MIKIAVCDDNPYELEEVAEKIKIYLDQQETALQTVVQTFQCGEYLIMEIESGHPADIFILDVDMPGDSKTYPRSYHYLSYIPY